MKKAILLFTAIISVMSCQKIKQDLTPEFTHATTQVIESITETPTYNLYIPEDEGGWQEGRVGLFNAWKQVNFTTVNAWYSEKYFGKVPIGAYVKRVKYACLIANGIPGDTWDTTANNPITRAGIRDLVVNADGSQSLPITVTTYSGGDVYLGRKKDEYDYTPTNQRLNAVEGSDYPGKDYTWWGWGDNYYNDAIIPDEDGLYVIAVTLDYGKPNPTTSLLPISVTGTTVITDTSAINANTAKPAINYKATLQHGRIKGVNITWEGNGYAYCIERDGQMILKWYDGRSFFDPAGNKFSRYKIITRAQGRIPDNETPEFKVTK